MQADEELILEANLVFYTALWKRDGQEFISDDAGGALATVTGDIWTPQGRWFDGTDDSISFGDASRLHNITTEISVLAWAKLEDTTGTRYIVAKGSQWAQGWHMVIFANGQPIFYVRTALGLQSADGGVGAVVTGRWYHIAGVCDAGAGYIRYYQNGQRLAVNTFGTDTIVDTTQPLRLGIRPDFDQALWKGHIGEVAVYNRALNENQINAHREATKGRYV